MTVKGDELVYNCRSCFATHGYGVTLKRNAETFECPNCNSKYVTQSGYMKRIS